MIHLHIYVFTQTQQVPQEPGEKLQNTRGILKFITVSPDFFLGGVRLITLHHVQATLAYSAQTDAVSSYLDSAISPDYNVATGFHHTCILKDEVSHICSQEELGWLRVRGIGVDALSVTGYKIAHILGVHFKSGEWGRHPRCGSVITCVIDGRSVYGYVRTFLRLENDQTPGYAVVHWFGAPQYPFENPLVVRVARDGSDLDEEIGCIVPITTIDPSCVVIEPDGQDHLFMMRLSGYDTIQS